MQARHLSSALWIDLRRRPVAWIIGLGLLATGIGAATAFLWNRADYDRLRNAPACASPSLPSPNGCYSDLRANVESVAYNPGTAHAPPSGSITVRSDYGEATLTMVNGDDATRFKSGDAITVRAWQSQIVRARSSEGAWVDLSDTPIANNAASGGLALAALSVGVVITTLLILGAIRRSALH